MNNSVKPHVWAPCSLCFSPILTPYADDLKAAEKGVKGRNGDI